MRVAVVGATGAVGSIMLDTVRRRGLAADEVVPFASPRSEGRTLDNADAPVRVLADDTISGFDLALFSALAEQGINIQMISTSPIKISCVIPATQVEHAVRSLHAAFDLAASAKEREHA